MSERFLQESDFDDIVSVYDSISFRIWRDSDKSNALIRLIQLDRTDEAKFLIENKAFKLDYANKNGETALSEAIKAENTDIIISLIDNGASLNNSDVGNPIFVAIMTGNTSIIETLMKNGANIESVDENGNNAFHYVINSKKPEEMVTFLLSERVDLEHKNDSGESPLYAAIKNGSITQAAILIKNGADTKTLDNLNQNLYFAAVTSQSKATLDFVKNYNKDVNAVNSNGDTPLLLSITLDNPEIMKKLIDLGANIEQKTRTTPLWHAYDNSGGTKISCLKVLAENGVNFNEKDKLGDTPLIKSISGTKNELTIAFIQWGADVNIADSKGNTPVQIAVQRKNTKILSYLIGAGADLLIRNKVGSTLLHTCVEGNDRDMLDLLLESKKITVDYPSTSGMTAAMFAFKSNKPELGDYLISKGASVNAADKNGKTLVSYRKDYYQKQINDANYQISENKNTISVLKSQNSAAEMKISSLRIDEQNAYNYYAKLQDEYEAAQRKYENLERDVNYAKSQMNFWDSSVDNWTRLYNNATTPATKSSANSSLNNARSEYNKWKRDYNSKNSSLLSLSIENSGKQIAASIAYAAYTKVSKQINEQNGIISSNESRISKLESENSNLSQKIITFQVELNRY